MANVTGCVQRWAFGCPDKFDFPKRQFRHIARRNSPHVGTAVNGLCSCTQSPNNQELDKADTLLALHLLGLWRPVRVLPLHASRIQERFANTVDYLLSD